MMRGGFVYMMANRYRGALYTGVAADLLRRVEQHQNGTGSEFCAQHGIDRLVWFECGDDIAGCIAQEKRLKRWRREWKFALIEERNPTRRDLIGDLR